MFSLDVKVDVKQALRVMKNLEKQIAFAQVQALNTVAFSIQRAEKAALPSVFSHPRPFTLNAVDKPTKATKANPVATIFIKPKSAVYLKAFEDGGAHYLPSRPELGRVRLEPVNIKTDAYGQFPNGAIDRLLARPDVFVAELYGIMGIWLRPPRGERRDGTKGTKGKLTLAPSGRGRTGLVLLAKVIPNAPVHKHLDFVNRGRAIFLKEYPDAFEKAFARAMATAKQ